MKIKKILLFLIPLLFLFPFGVFAKSIGFSYDANNTYYCKNNTCTKISLNYLQYAGNTYYNFRVPYESNTYSVNILALNSVNNIDVTDYDYVLMNVVTTNNYYFSSAKFTTSGVFGYALTSNYSAPPTIASTTNLNSSSYSYLIKFDVTDLTTLNGNLDFYFTQPINTFGQGIAEQADVYIDLQLYLGKNGDSVASAIDKNTEQNKKFYDDVLDTDTSDSQTKGSNFFKNYNSNSHGLSGIITAPLKFLQSLTGAKCSPLKFELPFVKKEVQLQCMKSIYQAHFGVFYTLWQTLTTGLIAYTVCLNFYKKIRDLQNPDNDKIEVLNL